ncbi:bile acid-CoA:amino acid N-acyltransferase-like isoform X2 [Littorina saxatilis]|uniref:Uncharacterized protein n=1 Tax=Littorina saxatilis TaxID=31220 RepID=A0AAN9GF59_9CAEN
MAGRLKQLQPIILRCAHPHSFSTQPEVIQVTPKVSLFDQKVHIKVQGLPSKTKVTLHATTQQEWRRKPVEFKSCSHYVTSDDGDLDLNRDVSVGGTYTGLDPMGPFWSLKPSPAGPQNIRMVVRNGDEPVLYNLSVYLGHLSLRELVATDTQVKPVYTTTVTRLKKSADVRRIPVREGNVRGILFLPPGEGPHPGVIDMFGSAGGLMELRATLLASHGFAVLALPFFKYEDLPAKLEDVTFDYFEEAVSWFSSHSAVKDDGIGVVAVSTGAQFALLMAWMCPQTKAAIHINSPPFYCLYNLHWKGRLFRKGIILDLNFAVPTEEGLSIRDCFPHTTDSFIPVWESSAHVLVLQSDDDNQVDPKLADVLYNLYPDDKRHLLEVMHYPGAGHLLEPPYSPHCRYCVNPTFGMDFLWGGNPSDHAVAQEDSWNRILKFLKTHLS